MQELKDKIVEKGTAIGSGIVKVDSIINHQLDVELISHIGQEFARLFAGKGINKVLTVEASGIPIAYATAVAMGNLPVVFAKKAVPSTMVEGSYSSTIVSFTKGTTTNVVVSARFLGSEDKVLVIDDFLATGEAARGLIEICELARAEICGFGAVIEKNWQGGGEYLRNKGIHLESLAEISSIEDGVITFAN